MVKVAHWAEVDENNIVLRVTVGNNDDPDEGYQWLVDNLGGRWIKTSYNGNIRVRFAGIGMYYDEVRDAFYLKDSPYPSWVFDEARVEWVPPTPYPNDGFRYLWDEPSTSWILL